MRRRHFSGDACGGDTAGHGSGRATRLQSWSTCGEISWHFSGLGGGYHGGIGGGRISWYLRGSYSRTVSWGGSRHLSRSAAGN